MCMRLKGSKKKKKKTTVQLFLLFLKLHIFPKVSILNLTRVYIFPTLRDSFSPFSNVSISTFPGEAVHGSDMEKSARKYHHLPASGQRQPQRNSRNPGQGGHPCVFQMPVRLDQRLEYRQNPHSGSGRFGQLLVHFGLRRNRSCLGERKTAVRSKDAEGVVPRRSEG
jgi:hypothetical protein